MGDFNIVAINAILTTIDFYTRVVINAKWQKYCIRHKWWHCCL